MAQVELNVTEPLDGFLRTAGLLICDRDTKYATAFKKTLKSAGINSVLMPYRAPNSNACPERLTLSIKSECTNKTIFCGEASLRRAINGYIEHYNTQRPPGHRERDD